MPITVKGVRRLIDGLVDNSLEALAKFNNKADDGDRLVVGGPIEVEGQYGVDQDGNLGFFANVVAPDPVEGSIGIEEGSGIGWNSEGAGTMRMSFKCEIVAVKGGSAGPRPAITDDLEPFPS